MLRIRDEQVLSLRKSLTQDVEDELFEDVKQFFKERHSFIGDSQARVAVRYGMDRAAHYGFTSLRGLALYVTLAFVLGSHFDKSPLYPWAHKNLVDDRELTETTRTHRFYNALRRYTRSTRDETGVYNESILRYPDVPIDPCTQSGAKAIEKHFVDALNNIAPAHFAEAGRPFVRELVKLAIDRAGERGLGTPLGLSVYVPLFFLLGVDFDEDPQFSWAKDALVQHDGALRLHDGALLFKKHTLTFVEQSRG